MSLALTTPTPLSGPAMLPGSNLFGHAHLFRKDRLALLRAAADAGPVTHLRFFHRSVLMVSAPEAAHQVLVEQARKFEKSPAIRILLRDMAGVGLFTSEGALWQRQRRLMSPLFHASALGEYAKVMRSIAGRTIANLKDGEAVNLAHEMTHVTMSVVASTLFGTDTETETDEIGRALTVALAWVNEHFATPALGFQMFAYEAFERLGARFPQRLSELRDRIAQALSEPRFLPGRNGAELQAAIRTVDAVVQRMISDRRANPNVRADLLTKLLVARDTADSGSMDDRQARDESVTLFVAGHETTATALAWTFYLLARNPEARARVQAEADAFDPEGDSASTLARLSYTTRVFKEALRLYPPVIMLPRRSTEPFELDGVEYPARTLVFVNAYGQHHSARTWPDSDRFDPDRFLPDNEAKRHKSAWLPFGAGARVCIGNHFALMEGPIVLSTWMQRARFDIDSTQTIKPDSFPTLRPKGGVPAVVRLRKRGDRLP